MSDGWSRGGQRVDVLDTNIVLLFGIPCNLLALSFGFIRELFCACVFVRRERFAELRTSV